MAYEIEDIRLSQEIFYYLLEHHELREDNELRLYKAYTQEETIQNLVKSQGEISDCHTVRQCDLSDTQGEQQLSGLFQSPDEGGAVPLQCHG